jgi:hypothetical protein
VALRNARTESKPERGQYEDHDVHEQSSDITVFNLYEQSWQTIVDEGLSHLFNDEGDFEQRIRGL